jgi:hypothetical protein
MLVVVWTVLPVGALSLQAELLPVEKSSKAGPKVECSYIRVFYFWNGVEQNLLRTDKVFEIEV